MPLEQILEEVAQLFDKSLSLTPEVNKKGFVKLIKPDNSSAKKMAEEDIYDSCVKNAEQCYNLLKISPMECGGAHKHFYDDITIVLNAYINSLNALYANTSGFEISDKVATLSNLYYDKMSAINNALKRGEYAGTALENLFQKRFNEIVDVLRDDDCLLEPEVDGHLMEIGQPEFYRFMHYFNKSDNPSGICQFVIKNTYTDFTNDEFGEEKELGIEHQKAMQELCDEIAEKYKDGFNFEVSIEPMALLWTKDGKYIDKTNFDEINRELENNYNQKKVRKRQ